MNNNLGLKGSHIAGEKNTISDYISRVETKKGYPPDFLKLKQIYPTLSSCSRYQLSPEMLLCLTSGLLQGHAPGLSLPKNKGHWLQGNNSF